jgi:predicted RNase H-like nuclease (RuvC/YqgF family)
MIVEEQLRELSLRIIVAASRAGIAYMEGETVERMADEILALRAELAAAKEKIADYEDYADDFRRVVSEECAPDEKHCSCVPHLRRQLAQRDAENAALVSAAKKLLWLVPEVRVVLDRDKHHVSLLRDFESAFGALLDAALGAERKP